MTGTISVYRHRNCTIRPSDNLKFLRTFAIPRYGNKKTVAAHGGMDAIPIA